MIFLYFGIFALLFVAATFVWEPAYLAGTLIMLCVGYGSLLVIHSVFWVLRWYKYPFTRKAPIFRISPPTPEEIRKRLNIN